MKQIKRIIISITDTCNLKCIHCYEKVRHKDKKQPLVNNKALLEWILSFNPKYIGISGGEPFTCFDKVKFFINNIPEKIKINIASNGLLISKEALDLLKNHKNVAIQISLDGNEQIHNLIRGKGTYEKTVNVIKLLLDSKIRTRIIFTINALNISCIEEHFMLIKNLGIKHADFERFVETDNTRELKLTKEKLKSAYLKIVSLEQKYGITVHVNDPMFLVFKLTRNSILSKEIISMIGSNCELGCSLYTNSMYVDFQGNIYSCTFLKDKIGNCFDYTKDEVIEEYGKKFIEINEKNTKCKYCLYNKICGGCKAIPYYNKDGVAENSLCWMYTKKI